MPRKTPDAPGIPIDSLDQLIESRLDYQRGLTYYICFVYLVYLAGCSHEGGTKLT